MTEGVAAWSHVALTDLLVNTLCSQHHHAPEGILQLQVSKAGMFWLHDALVKQAPFAARPQMIQTGCVNGNVAAAQTCTSTAARKPQNEAYWVLWRTIYVSVGSAEVVLSNAVNATQR